MKADISTLRVDVDKIRSTYISMIWGYIPLHDGPKYVPGSVLSVKADQSSVGGTTIGSTANYVTYDDEEERVEDVDEEMDDEEIWKEKDEQHITLTLMELYDHEETMVHSTLDRSLKETSTTGTN
uniref:Polyprotein protein n=1 Tax=Solanum tuberosum TaxID=4113 RepID=M1DDW7_SOLTU